MPQPTDADLILLGGQITTMAERGPAEVSALAIRSGRVLATGTDDEIRALAGPATSELDLSGRRVVPGLIDGHVHFVRAGRTWNDELRWEDVYDLEEALALVRAEAARRPAGEWIRVIGGWDEKQFAQGRGPTREELDAAAPSHPVYIQMGYTYAQLNTQALDRIGLDDRLAGQVEADLAGAGDPGSFERDEAGALTGRGFGMPLMAWFYRQLPTPGFPEQVASTIALSSEFARLGMTGAIDGGGVNTGPDAYGAVYEAWRRGKLRTRVRLFKHAAQSGTEEEDFGGYLRYESPRFGDGMLKVSGVGEVILFKSHDRFGTPADDSPEALAELEKILSGFAARGWSVQLHVRNRRFIEGVIEVWERIHAQHPIDQLRWGIVHADAALPEDVPRLQHLGAGLYIQSLMRFSGERAIARVGAQRVAAAPPVRALLDGGVQLSLGSDAMRAASYNPFTSLQYFLTGLTVSGTPTLAKENLLTREQALRGYTLNNAWFTHEERERGSLEPGKLADLAVLSADYFTVPVEQMHTLTSELTLLGGEVIWSSGTVAPQLA